MGDHQHRKVAVESYCPDCGTKLGQIEFERQDLAELEGEHATALPGREAMSLVNANVALPVNLALAANVLSDGSIAGAGATQNTPIDQSALPTVS
jgi:hypothetical protein